MQRSFNYQVICLVGKVRIPYKGSIMANSESEVRAYLMSHYSNIVDIQVW